MVYGDGGLGTTELLINGEEAWRDVGSLQAAGYIRATTVNNVVYASGK